MKNTIPILFFFLILISCSDKKATKDRTDHPDSQTETISKKSEIDKTKINVFETKTGKSFEVKENKISASISNIIVKTKGFSIVNETIYLKEMDPISEMLIADLDKNNFEELYIITRSSGSGSYASIYAFASNKDKSISSVVVPEIAQSDLAPGAILHGYRGHDSIYISKHKLYRKFPVYKENDKNCCPTGGTETIKYKLISGEASWRLEVID